MVTTLLDLDWPVRTDRLLVRPAVAADTAATRAIRARPDVSRWLTSAVGDPASYATRFVEPERLGRTLVVERAGVLVGDLMLRLEDGWAQAEVAGSARDCQAELGWVLDPQHQGVGLGTEMVEALLGVAFDGLGLRRVTAGCFADNLASWRLMERVGMRREQAMVAESLHRDLGWVDSYGYALLASEWARPTATATGGVSPS